MDIVALNKNYEQMNRTLRLLPSASHFSLPATRARFLVYFYSRSEYPLPIPRRQRGLGLVRKGRGGVGLLLRSQERVTSHCACSRTSRVAITGVINSGTESWLSIVHFRKNHARMSSIRCIQIVHNHAFSKLDRRLC